MSGCSWPANTTASTTCADARRVIVADGRVALGHATPLYESTIFSAPTPANAPSSNTGLTLGLTLGNAGSAFDLNGGLLGATFNDCVSARFDSSLQVTVELAPRIASLGIDEEKSLQAANPYDGDTYVQIGAYHDSLAGGLSGGLQSATGTPAVQSMVLYAPTSEVSASTVACLPGNTFCSPGLFEGNIIGADVFATAAAFQQDLDLGELALYSGIDLYHVSRYLQCSPVSHLTGDETVDTSGC